MAAPPPRAPTAPSPAPSPGQALEPPASARAAAIHHLDPWRALTAAPAALTRLTKQFATSHLLDRLLARPPLKGPPHRPRAGYLLAPRRPLPAACSPPVLLPPPQEPPSQPHAPLAAPDFLPSSPSWDSHLFCPSLLPPAFQNPHPTPSSWSFHITSGQPDYAWLCPPTSNLAP